MEVTFRFTLELDEKWTRGQTKEELVEYLETRLNSSLGFKGAVQKFSGGIGRANVSGHRSS